MGAPRVQPTGDDPVQVDPKHYKIEHEDERLRVVRVRYGPHEKSAMHGHPAAVAIFLTDHHCRFMYPDGRIEEIRANAGEVRQMGPFEHLPENLSDRPFELVLVELKS